MKRVLWPVSFPGIGPRFASAVKGARMYEETRDLSLGSDYSVGSSDPKPQTPTTKQSQPTIKQKV